MLRISNGTTSRRRAYSAHSDSYRESDRSVPTLTKSVLRLFEGLAADDKLWARVTERLERSEFAAAVSEITNFDDPEVVKLWMKHSRDLLTEQARLVDRGYRHETVTKSDDLGIDEINDILAEVFNEPTSRNTDIAAASAAASSLADAGEDAARSYFRPAISRWMVERITGELAALNTALSQTLLQVVKRGIESDSSIRKMADEMKRALGLAPRDEIAVTRRYQAMIDQGMRMADAVDVRDRYTKKLLRSRAEQLARTESVAAFNAGRVKTWEARQNLGLNGQMYIQWVSGPGSDGITCAQCLALDKAPPVPVGGVFRSDRHRPVPHPPLHPRCRCSMVFRTEIDVDA